MYNLIRQNASSSGKISNSTEDIMEEIFNVNYMEIMQQSSSDVDVSLHNQEETTSSQDTNVKQSSMINYILSCLCEHISLTQYNTLLSEDIGNHIKAPYILCNDFPTINLIESLLRNNMKNEEILFCNSFFIFENFVRHCLTYYVRSLSVAFLFVVQLKG